MTLLKKKSARKRNWQYLQKIIHNYNFQKRLVNGHSLWITNLTIKGCFEIPVKTTVRQLLPFPPASQIASTGDASDHRLFQSIWALVWREYLEVLDHRLFQSILGSETLVSWPQSAPSNDWGWGSSKPRSRGWTAYKPFHCPFCLIWQHFDWLISLENIFCYIVIEQH